MTNHGVKGKGQGITRQRVPWIREANQSEVLAAPPAACVVESIRW